MQHTKRLQAQYTLLLGIAWRLHLLLFLGSSAGRSESMRNLMQWQVSIYPVSIYVSVCVVVCRILINN